MKLWEVAGQSLAEVTQSKLDLESRLEDWVESDIGLISAEFFIIGRQVPTDFGGFIDILCVDRECGLVIVELKKDKTPREITAQALDYASWCAGLQSEQIVEIANKYLGKTGPFEVAFRKKFNSDPAEALNQSHKIFVVGTEIDGSSERIMKYLFDSYGVPINAVTFQFFRTQAGKEFVSRVFLMDPGKAPTSSVGKKRYLTYEELQQLAVDHGAGEIYKKIFDAMRERFDSTRTTRSSVGFISSQGGKQSAILNLIPGEPTSPESGLHFQVYSKRLSDFWGVAEKKLIEALPSGSKPWAFFKDAPPEWSGYQGFFKTFQDAERLIDAAQETPEKPSKGHG